MSEAVSSAVSSAASPAETGPRTLWMGDLAYWVDENFMGSLFASTGEVVSAKIIRNKLTGYSEGYGFVEFASNAAAQTVLQTYNGAPIPGTDLFFKLNWASHSSAKGGQGGQGQGEEGLTSPEHSVFVGDLSPEVTDYALQEYFRQFYTSVKSARVVTDPATGRPKGYGFVRFVSEPDRDKAIVEMNGQVVGSRAIRVSLATPKRSGGGGANAPPGSSSSGQQYRHHQYVGGLRGMYPMMGYGGARVDMQGQSSGNTTLYIGGIAPSTTEEDIRGVFATFGDIVYVKIALAKACAFVQYVLRESAAMAISSTNGQVIKGNTIRVSWGRQSEQRSQMVPHQAPHNPYGYYGGYYGYDPQYYAAYGMALQPGMMSGQVHQVHQAVTSSQHPRNSKEGGKDDDAVTAGSPSSVEEMNRSYGSMASPYAVESNNFISSVPPVATSPTPTL
ncbi:RNA-binding protein [Chloropicon primus]|uniref:RNA-binding protein n=3 Tax=Chloropicon primus TaxID=1764295 RepID=A0A5B8MLQ2_9CHLO|nr:RNA-binding protein [Chloropicon primus]UPR00582.1 RNA-binding protein [Chloropicon primus]|eukprot:QDZ21367.1 RNA-binding protein [Chloropicon primus]